MEKDNSKKYLFAGLVLFALAMGILFFPKWKGALESEIWKFDDTQVSDTDEPNLRNDTSSTTPPPLDFSTESSSVDYDGEIFDVVEAEPQFSGGEIAMQDFIKKKVKYPEMAIQMGDQGKVYVRFVVEKDGSVTNVEIARGTTKELDLEAMRVIRMMPKWIPGKQRGKPVRTRVVVPISFKLM
jgi:protein TonB